jgi:hypothetical protein
VTAADPQTPPVPTVRGAAAPVEVALLASVFVIAACGLLYELAAAALASYVLGDSVLQFSTVIGAYLFAMGVGSYLSRFFERQLPAHFLRIELLVALAGGLLASQVGKGTGKHVAIAAGSATGALIGKNMAEQAGSTSYVNQQVQVCRPVTQWREQVRDYTVRYAYQGQEYTVNLPQHPGEWLKLTVSHGVTPI